MAMINTSELGMGFWLGLGLFAAAILVSLLMGVFRKVS